MPESSLHYYACGETDHQIADIFRGHTNQVRTFPAGVFLFQHASGENVLFDTGYSTSIYKSGLRGAAYRRVLPPRIKVQDEIHNQLLNDGIAPSSIGHVVLSHLHPDHIGGVQFFPEAQFVMSRGMSDTLAKPRFKEGVFNTLIPPWFDSASKHILGSDQLQSNPNGLVKGYDLLGDNSFIVTELPGHARGHLGALVLDKALLAGDAAWGKDFLSLSHDMRAIPRFVNDDMNAYHATNRYLQQVATEGIELYFSHDTYNDKILLP